MRPSKADEKGLTCHLLSFVFFVSFVVKKMRGLCLLRYMGWRYLLAKKNVAEHPVRTPAGCSKCGGRMRLVEITDADGGVVLRHRKPYPDSG